MKQDDRLTPCQIPADSTSGRRSCRRRAPASHWSCTDHTAAAAAAAAVAAAAAAAVAAAVAAGGDSHTPDSTDPTGCCSPSGIETQCGIIMNENEQHLGHFHHKV